MGHPIVRVPTSQISRFPILHRRYGQLRDRRMDRDLECFGIARGVLSICLEGLAESGIFKTGR